VPRPHGFGEQSSLARQRAPSSTRSKPPAQVAQVESLAVVQVTLVQSAIAAQATHVVPSLHVPSRQVHAKELAPVSRHVPVPHGASAQSSMSPHAPAASTAKPLLQVAQVASDALVQVVAWQSAIAAHALQVVPSSKVPARQVQS